jgi:CxxC motif-containing protein (DUF1111 family)
MLRCATMLATAASLCAGCQSLPAADPLSGGSDTVYDATSGAYANPDPDLTDAELSLFNLGHTFFDQSWVTAPATTDDIDGLGPLFNQRSCSACHSHDGRSAPFDQQGALLGMLFRLSVVGQDAHGGPLGDPVYGTQLRPLGILTIPGDGTPVVAYSETASSYGDGTAYSLQTPSYSITGWNYGPPAANLMISARTGPFTIGLGLLEAISESDILAGVHVDDPDGVVGKPNYVWDPSANAMALGRFGWKANVPSVRVQTAGALSGDMGITSSIDPNSTCASIMTACNAAPNGGDPEIDDDDLASITLYMETLAVPARRDYKSAKVAHGESLFAELGCTSCHTPTFTTGPMPQVPELANQTIHPYTDLLLHDMGEGLADGRPDYEASGSMWRTPPLWGIGLLMEVNDHDFLLHDARARGLEEAILWHGGEAMAARERFRLANSSDRDALIAFLNSL